MPRLRGPTISRLPDAEAQWASLNERLFGAFDAGGPSVLPAPEALPIDWLEVFGRVAPLGLEIGFNRGRFLRDLARGRPDEDFVGVEIRRRYSWHLCHAMQREGETARNLRIIWGDAKLVAPAVFGRGALSNIYINFPDPWWKRRHVKRRLVDSDFAETMSALLAPGGRIWVKSDVEAIGEEISAALAGVQTLAGPEPFEAEALPFTTREVRCVHLEMPIWRFSYARV